MKKIILFIFSLVIGLAFTACEDPYANQIVAEPGGYEQGAKQDVNFVVALKSGVSPIAVQVTQLPDSFALLTCTSLPTLIDTMATIAYHLQISNKADFSVFVDMNSSYSGVVGADIKIGYQDLNDKLLAYNNAVAEQTVYARVLAVISNNGLQTAVKSSVLSFLATPYKNPLKPYTEVTPRPYFIIGMANGAWNNSAAGLGVSIYPMTVVPGENFNTAGDGLFTFTGYFWASRGFKLIRDLGNWDEQWGAQGNDITKPKHNDSGSSDFKVPTDGYYTLTLNSVDQILTIVPATITPVTYNQIGLIGDFNGWNGDVVMSPCETSNNHNWYTTYTFTGDDMGKFRADGGWTMNWGTPSDTMDGDPLYMFTGIGKKDGKNIGVKAGTYVVLFNDIDGGYWFFKQ